MSCDLNILVIDQEKPSTLPFQSTIEVIDESNEKLRYRASWRYMTSTKGSWYCLGHTDDPCFNAYSILEADLDTDIKNRFLPYWVDNEKIRSNLIPCSIVKEYAEDFFRILSYLVEQSPVRTIMFLAKLQSNDEEIICGVLSLEQFCSLHNQGKILFNVCYLIRG